MYSDSFYIEAPDNSDNMGLFTSRKNEQVRIAAHDNSSADTVIQQGDLEYTTDIGGNGKGATIQEASGAPVETTSPLGTHVNWFTVIFLNIGQMIGTGVFSTRKFDLLRV